MGWKLGAGERRLNVGGRGLQAGCKPSVGGWSLESREDFVGV